MVFIGIVWFNFSEPEIDKTIVEAARLWRLNVGHDFQYYDASAGVSLIARVCAGDRALSIWVNY